jgi:hypothetical protein
MLALDPARHYEKQIEVRAATVELVFGETADEQDIPARGRRIQGREPRSMTQYLPEETVGYGYELAMSR